MRGIFTPFPLFLASISLLPLAGTPPIPGLVATSQDSPLVGSSVGLMGIVDSALFDGTLVCGKVGVNRNLGVSVGIASESGEY